MLNEKTSSFEKIAQEDESLAQCIVKVAEDNVNELSDEEIVNDYIDEARENGIDVETEEFEADLNKAAESGELFDNRVESAVELIANDIEEGLTKAAEGGDPGFTTNAAAKAVEDWMNLSGASTLGSGFGMAPNTVGSSLSPSVDANVFGGYGRQIYTGGQYSRAVNAVNKPGNAIAGNNLNNIRLASDEASDEEVFGNLLDICKEAADAEEQSLEQYLYDVGMEEINEEVTDEADVNSFTEQSKKASDAVYEWIEKTASENEMHPDDLVIYVGLSKAASTLDDLAEYLEKEAKAKTKAKPKASGFSKTLKKFKGSATDFGNAIKKDFKTVGKDSKKIFAGTKFKKVLDGRTSMTTKAKNLGSNVSAAGKGIGKFIGKHKYTAGAAGVAAAGAAFGGRALYKKLKGNNEEKEASAQEPESYMAKLVAQAKADLYNK